MAAQSDVHVAGFAQAVPKSRWKHVIHNLRRDKFLYLLISPGIPVKG